MPEREAEVPGEDAERNRRTDGPECERNTQSAGIAEAPEALEPPNASEARNRAVSIAPRQRVRTGQ